MGCFNDGGVLRPLLSGSAASGRNGNSTNITSHNGARYIRNKTNKRNGNRKGAAPNGINKNGISHRQTNAEGVTSDYGAGDNYNCGSDDDDYDEFYDDEDVIVGYSGVTSDRYQLCPLIIDMLRKIGLLVWKNLLLRRRHYIVTALEIILPTLCAMILAAGRTSTGQGPSIDSGNQTIVYPIRKEAELKQSLSYQLTCGGCFIAYAPDNVQTNEAIQELRRLLQPQLTRIDWRPYKNEEDIEKLIASLNFNDTAKNSFRAAIIFEDGLSGAGNTVSYKIRMVDQLQNTGLLFPVIQIPGPGSENEKAYAHGGFTGLQIYLDRVIAKRLTGRDIPQSISTQAFPYPPFTLTFDFSLVYFLLLPLLLVLGFIFMVPSIIRAVVSEKETGIRELLKLNGLPGWMQWLGWMINSMLILSISITIVIFLFFWTFNIESGAVLVYSDPSLWWVVLFMYAMSASSSCFFVASFFRKPTLATTIGIILWLVSYFLCWTRIVKSYESVSTFEKLGISLLPNMALHLAIKVMSAFEGKAVGARWSNIAEPISSVDPLCLGHMMLMFLLNTLMYMLLTIYVENVLPSEYGVRKPWYYIFQANTWRRKGSSIQTKEEALGSESDYDMPGFEAQPSDLQIGVDIKNLRKVFGRNKIAVAGVNAKMYDGEIFALLGHNGAGKTTTISMLTGLFAPTEGTAKIHGYDINSDLDTVRQNLGLCPQHNMLFDKLTVSEHLRFFGQLKGLTSAEATKEMKQLLQKLQLSEKESTLSMALSGGQKRKLSLGIALIGGTKVVILDEPTSGMDPEARRAIWDLLLEMRGHRTILLTTHFMEEADVLGDRIGIMSNGKLQCCGTPLFLKKYYGTGYTLKLSFHESGDQNVILSFVQNHVPNASIKISQSTMSESEMLVTLPTETATTSILSELFNDFTENKEPLGIKSIGLSLTTMDEVFLKVGELTDDHSNAVTESGQTSTNGTPEVQSKASDERRTLKKDRERSRGLTLVKEQFLALFIKKYIYTLRKRKLVLSQLVIPILILILAILASNANFEIPDPPPPLKITLDSYKNPVTLFSAGDPNTASVLTKAIGPTAKGIPEGSTLLQAIADLGKSDLASYRERHIVALEANSTHYNAMFNTIPNHAAPLAINLATNALLKNMDPSKNYRIRVTNHPLKSSMEAMLEAAKPDPVFAQTVPIMFAVFMPIGLALLAASFVVFPIEERLCKAKQLQMMSGVSPLTYWASAFVWDFFTIFIVVCAMTLCFPIFQSHSVFTSYGGGGVAFLILLVYGYSAISFSYLASLFTSTVAGGFAFVTIIHIASGMILCILVHVMEIGEMISLATDCRWVGRLFPTFGAAISTMRYSEIASKNGRCSILSEAAMKLVCDPSIKSVPPEQRECCANCDALGVSCFKPTPYITWNYEKSAFAGLSDNTVTTPGIGQELLYLVIMGLVYQVLLLLIEYGIIQKLLGKVFQTKESAFSDNITDEDVSEESQRVKALVSSGNVSNDALVVDQLSKSYGSFSAVSKLSFGVHHGECFGLLGVNGAGKTTTFRILTGDEYRSFGNVYASVNTLEKNRKKYLSDIGYCPQFDGIIGVLTGREMLQLFCRLRGVPGRYGQEEADKWLNKLGLLESGNVQCGKYSGGMKRRLSTAMAMIGDPPLLLLDEPTSGVDPVSRRQFWKVLESVRNSGQAIILTSHSMDECEALCSRLGILVNGNLQCLGKISHLKNKFAQGYSLSLKLKPNVPVESDELNKLTGEISQKFYPCTLKDKHQNMLQYQVHNTSIPWNVLFNTMEDLKTAYSGILEDYSVNETSLEEVFLSFARRQYEHPRKADVSIIKQLITCQFC